jgi:hypothetical protein
MGVNFVSRKKVENLYKLNGVIVDNFVTFTSDHISQYLID